MIVSIHQPAYLPWLGYFDKILRSELFIYLDTVQFQKGSFQNRNLVRNGTGTKLLTVPILLSGHLYDTPLSEVQIDCRRNWRRKHAETIRQNYQTAPMFALYWPAVLAFYERKWIRLADLCSVMLTWFNAQLGIDTRIVRASDLAPTFARKSDVVLDLCQQVGATEYISGSQGRDYLDLPSFAKAGISVRFQDYRHPVYNQGHTPFQPNLAILDLLLNEPQAGRILRDGLSIPLTLA
jgi:WbqC-like protein family